MVVLFDWYAILGVQNKQGEIEWWCRNSKSIVVKSYEGGYKIMLSGWQIN
jgi:DNA polymerase-3 subunit delta'